MKTKHNLSHTFSLPDDAVEVGRIAGAWGIKGDIRVLPYSNEPEALFASKLWYILPADNPIGPRKTPLGPQSSTPSKIATKGEFMPHHMAGLSLPTVLTMKNVRVHGGGIVATALEIPDRNVAELLKNTRIFISRSYFPKLKKGEYYWIDLIGLQVINAQGEKLGVVSDLMSNGAQNILQVTYTSTDKQGQPKSAERLIPFVDAFVGDVDRETGVIHVDWPSDF